MRKDATPTCEEFGAIWEGCGGESNEYLRMHYPRFLKTQELVLRALPAEGGRRVLDLGAHLLHQAVLYAREGFSVTAADLGSMSFGTSQVVERVAREFGIRLVAYKNLDDPVELETLPADSFEIVLFTDILEHLPFNPVRMWAAIHRLLAPRGRIFISTPNYFNLSGDFPRDCLSVVRGRSAGIPVRRILERHAPGNHWKVYSARDIREYFGRLSPDFRIKRLVYYNYHREPGLIRSAARAVQRVLVTAREALFVEVELVDKKRGIVIEPRWT